MNVAQTNIPPTRLHIVLTDLCLRGHLTQAEAALIVDCYVGYQALALERGKVVHPSGRSTAFRGELAGLFVAICEDDAEGLRDELGKLPWPGPHAPTFLPDLCGDGKAAVAMSILATYAGQKSGSGCVIVLGTVAAAALAAIALGNNVTRAVWEPETRSLTVVGRRRRRIWSTTLRPTSD